jgi:hypothetical protein
VSKQPETEALSRTPGSVATGVAYTPVRIAS